MKSRCIKSTPSCFAWCPAHGGPLVSTTDLSVPRQRLAASARSLTEYRVDADSRQALTYLDNWPALVTLRRPRSDKVSAIHDWYGHDVLVALHVKPACCGINGGVTRQHDVNHRKGGRAHCR